MLRTPWGYLGIHVSTNPNDQFKLNYTPLLHSIKEDLDRWNKLPLSINGRISTVSIHLFAMTPMNPAPGWFSLNSAVNSFYWKGKRPRIKITTLQKPKQYGGLNSPNFYQYFLSHQLHYIWHWTNNLNSPCLDTEQTTCNDLPIQHIAFIDKTVRTHSCFKFNTTNTTLTAWWKANDILNLKLSPATLTPIWHKPMFKINKEPINFPAWKKRGVTSLWHLFSGSSLMTFDFLKQTQLTLPLSLPVHTAERDSRLEYT